jgi:hypothetical protein
MRVRGDHPQGSGNIGVLRQNHKPANGLKEFLEKTISIYRIRPWHGIVHPVDRGLGVLGLLAGCQLATQCIFDMKEFVLDCFGIPVQLAREILPASCGGE